MGSIFRQTYNIRGEYLLPLLPLISLLMVAAVIDFPFLAAGLLIIGYAGWIWIIRCDYVTAYTVFFALLPLWQYLKFIQFPGGTMVGVNSNLPTVVKELFLLTLFGHWFLTRTPEYSFKIMIPRTLLIFLLVLPLALFYATRGSPVQFLLLLRPYVEMFILVAVPLLELDLSSRDVDKLLIGFITAGTTFAVVGVYHFFVDPTFLIEGYLRPAIWNGQEGSVGTAFYGGRLQSIAANPNNLAIIALITCFLSLRFVKMKRISKSWRALAVVIFGIAALTVFLARSRDDVGLLFLGIAVFAAITRDTKVLAIGGAGIAGGLLFKWQEILIVFVRLIKNGNPRIHVWINAFHKYGLSLMTGGSTGTGLELIDSTYLLMLIHIGVIGTGLFLLINVRLVCSLLRKGGRLGDNRMVALGVILLVFMGSMLLQTAFYNFPFTTYYWGIMALGTVDIFNPDIQVTGR